jgi:uncharacterized protein YdeI (YjbR/CyaY-like superfamily)
VADTGTNPKVDDFLRKPSKWQEAYRQLRRIVLDCNLTEDFKWMHPCYTFEGKNVVLIHGFKEYCALLFPKGALLQDAHGVLVRQTENVQGARQIRFTSAEEIVAMEETLKAYVHEAIEVERSGLTVKLKGTAEFPMTEELERKFDELPALRTAFEALTPGRQRAYLLYFSQPKQAKTRQARVEKYVEHIFAGKGLNDSREG